MLMTARSSHTTPDIAGPSMSRAAVCAVSLIDRRTGRPHLVNGRPLVLFTRHPGEAVTDLMQGRDGAVWEARVDRLGQGGRK
jgi:hypothetical protein